MALSALAWKFHPAIHKELASLFLGGGGTIFIQRIEMSPEQVSLAAVWFLTQR